jgi:DNA repair protein RecO (recombination protein O)
VPLYRDEAVVLRTQKLGEADRIITILSRSLGQIRCVGKGVRRTTSRFGSRLEPFTHVDIQLYTGRSLDVVNQVETIHSYGAALVSDYPAYTAGTAMLETAERLTSEEREPAVQQYLLLVGGLRALEERVHQPRLVLDSYLLRSLSVAGWAPSFSDCARCGTPGPHSAFHISSGGSVCPACRPAGSLSPAPEVVALLAARHSFSGTWSAACARCGSSIARWEDEIVVAKRLAPTPHPSGARPPAIPSDLLPRHVAIVMDGNGRWAKQQGLPRTKGHEAGEASLLDCVHGAIELGITHLSAYAFSTENWRRSPDEVRFLMGFNRDVIRRRRDEMNNLGVACGGPGGVRACGSR